MIPVAETPEAQRDRPLTDPLRADARPWPGSRVLEWLAVLAALAPMAALVLWMYVLRETPPTLTGLLLWPLLGGGAFILWLVFLQILVCGDSLEGLGFRKPRPGLDVLLGALGSLLLLGIFIGLRSPLARLFPRPQPPEEIVTLISGLSRNPLLLALWLGPVVWIGIAGFEELWRAFMLRRLWRLWGGPAGQWGGLLVVSALFGLVHCYQGTAAVISIGLLSILVGWFFMATGRIRALIVAHALFDSIQIVTVVVAIRQALT